MSLMLAVARSLSGLDARFIGGAIHSVPTRHFGKRKAYGYEEGHGEKNEVRKDYWWRKRNPPRKPWGDYKSKRNLHPAVLAWGPNSQTPDWSYEDGHPGVLNKKQAMLRADNIRLVKEVHEAALLVLKARQFEKAK